MPDDDGSTIGLTPASADDDGADDGNSTAGENKTAVQAIVDLVFSGSPISDTQFITIGRVSCRCLKRLVTWMNTGVRFIREFHIIWWLFRLTEYAKKHHNILTIKDAVVIEIKHQDN